MFTGRIWIMLLLVVAVCGSTVIPVCAQDGAPPATPPPVTTIPADGFNMKVVEKPTPYYVITTLDPPVFNWFAGTFTNLPTDKEVTIGLNMNGMDHLINKADVSKWVGLKTVMTYSDPTKYESYEWFWKDDNDWWLSGDPLKAGGNKIAGNGELPIQHVIPNSIAKEFLSADKRYWCPWREIETSTVVPDLNIFRIQNKFAEINATIYWDAGLTLHEDVAVYNIGSHVYNYCTGGNTVPKQARDSEYDLDADIDTALQYRMDYVDARIAGMSADQKKNVMYVAIHANTAGSANPCGTLVFYYDSKGQSLANKVYNGILTDGSYMNGNRTPPNVSYNDLYVLHNNPVAAAYVESAFMTNTTRCTDPNYPDYEQKLLFHSSYGTSWRQQVMGHGIFNGVQNYLASL